MKVSLLAMLGDFGFQQQRPFLEKGRMLNGQFVAGKHKSRESAKTRFQLSKEEIREERKRERQAKKKNRGIA